MVIGGLATAGAQLAVRYVNDQLGGVGGHPVALVQCFIKSNEEEGTTCGQKLVNNKRISVIATGAVATGAQSLFATIRGAKPVVTGVATTPVDGAQRNAVVLFGDGPHILLPFGTYAKNVLKAKTAAVIYPQATGITEAGLTIAAGLKQAGIDDEGGRLHAGPDRPDRAVDRGRGDDGGLHRPLRHGVRLREPGEGAPAARHHRLEQDHDGAALPQLAGDRRARRLAALDVRDRLVALRRSDRQGHARLQRGDQAVQGGEERAGSVAHRRVRRAPDDRPVPQRGRREERERITPARVLARAKAFKGPLALGPPKIQCGKYKDAPGICNDMFQAFTYKGKFAVHEGVRLDRAAPLVRATLTDGAGHSAGPVLPSNAADARERDPPLPVARPRNRGDDRGHRGRHRRHVPGLGLHQPGRGRDRHARGLLVLGAPDR